MLYMMAGTKQLVTAQTMQQDTVQVQQEKTIRGFASLKVQRMGAGTTWCLVQQPLDRCGL